MKLLICLVIFAFPTFAFGQYLMPNLTAPPPVQISPPIDDELKPYVEMFVQHSGGRVSSVDFEGLMIHFGTLSYGEGAGKIIGLCEWGDVREITIDRKYWKEAPLIQQWALLFHEMGHCVCNRMHPPEDQGEKILNVLDLLGISHVHGHHSNNLLSDGCPKSLMFPTSFQDSCAYAHRDYYEHEMFENCLSMTTLLRAISANEASSPDDP